MVGKWHERQAVRYGAALVGGVIVGAVLAGGGGEVGPVADVEPVAEEVDVTLEACRDAIAYARDGFGEISVYFTFVQRAIDALAVIDTEAVDAAIADMTESTAEFDAIAGRFNGSADECEAA